MDEPPTGHFPVQPGQPAGRAAGEHPGRAAVDAAVARVAPAATARLGADEGARFTERVGRWYGDVSGPLDRLYGADHDTRALADRLLDRCLDASAARPAALRRLDYRRELRPTWFLDADRIGYVCYVDRFCGNLAALPDHLDYLEELGVTYLHLMPLLRPRPGPNDGGYAVADYLEVDPRLGTMADLEAVAEALRDRGISLVVDLVVNHTAREHEWARRAMAGDPAYRDFYLCFADRTVPDAYEATLPEVFPDSAPGSFSWVDELESWVWTTFHDYQWDLNYANPHVFAAMLDVMLTLANRGVEVLRLDAVPFIWKRLGTTCQNQPEVHDLLQAFRALVRIAAPAMIFKAEAIVPPEILVRYLGSRESPAGAAFDRTRPECDLAYHNQLMVLLWSSLATREARVATHALSRMRTPPPGTGWVTYVRGHDDIGWAITPVDAAAGGFDAFAHRDFLNAFYAGEHPGSFGRGLRFQPNPVTGDARMSGSAAALCGIAEALALGDEGRLEDGIRRLLLAYGVVAAYGGIPLVYMGDELASLGDPDWAQVPAQAGDNRWVHRPHMDWAAAARRTDPATLEGRAFAGLQRLLRTRARLPVLGGGPGVRVTPMATDNPAILAWARFHPSAGAFLGCVNVSEQPQSCDDGLLARAGVTGGRDALGGDPLRHGDGRIHLDGLSQAWFVHG
jgi:amylosucrase